MSSLSLEKILTDPVSLNIMKNPVITQCSHSFEKSKLEEWLKRGSTCPTCNANITNFVPNRALKDVSEYYLESTKKINVRNIDYLKDASLAFIIPYIIQESFHLIKKYPQILVVIGSVSFLAYTIKYINTASSDSDFDSEFDFDREVEKTRKISERISNFFKKYTAHIWEENKKELVVTLALSTSIVVNFNSYNFALITLISGFFYILGQQKNSLS